MFIVLSTIVYLHILSTLTTTSLYHSVSSISLIVVRGPICSREQCVCISLVWDNLVMKWGQLSRTSATRTMPNGTVRSWKWVRQL